MSARDSHPALAALERDNVAYGPAATKALNEIDALRRECAAWMNGVADVVEPFGYDRGAACGPADLLPGLTDLRVHGMETARRLHECVESRAILYEEVHELTTRLERHPVTTGGSEPIAPISPSLVEVRRGKGGVWSVYVNGNFISGHASSSAARVAAHQIACAEQGLY